MAKNSYQVFFEQLRGGDEIIPSDVVVEDRGQVVVSLRLPRQPSYHEMMQLMRAVSNDKPPSLIRDIVAGWIQQLEITKGRGEQC